jgi:hypothetical protein
MPRALFLVTCLVSLFSYPAVALADFRSGSVLDLQDALRSSGDPAKPNRDIKQLTASYDQSGALKASVTLHAPVVPGENADLSFNWHSDPSGTCSGTGDATSIESNLDASRGQIVLGGKTWAPKAVDRSFSPDGRTVTVSVSGENWAGFDYRCVSLRVIGGLGGDTAVVYFAGYAPPDKSAPTAKLQYAKTQRASNVSVTVQLKEPGTVAASGSVAVPGGASKVYKFKSVSVSVEAKPKTKLRLKLPRTALRAVRRALQRKKLKAKIAVIARDQTGNGKTSTFTVKLKR